MTRLGETAWEWLKQVRRVAPYSISQRQIQRQSTVVNRHTSTSAVLWAALQTPLHTLEDLSSIQKVVMS